MGPIKKPNPSCTFQLYIWVVVPKGTHLLFSLDIHHQKETDENCVSFGRSTPSNLVRIEDFQLERFSFNYRWIQLPRIWFRWILGRV
ncbi:hypothetical protein CASFOL_001748 [Castilleja foliolosa]|uniref:Uncharacterized protein n=1 Tax=Castilleja foliolosa TaxID=1961234 RepID=A0ABD3ECP1_9LAMI